MKTFFWLIAISLTSMLMSRIGYAQSSQKTYMQGNRYSSPDAIVKQLESKMAAMNRPYASAPRVPDPITGDCIYYDRVDMQRVEFTRNNESRLLIVESLPCQTMYIVPVLRKGQYWITLSPINLSTQFSKPEYRIESLIKPGESEIVVSNHTVDEGTGILQRNMTIYKVIGETIRVIFDEPESINIAIPDKRVPITSNYVEDQNSTFIFRKNIYNSICQKYIDEKRDEVIGDKKYTVYRTYFWEPEIQIFRMLGSDPAPGAPPMN